VNHPYPLELHATVIALRVKYDEIQTLMHNLDLEMAGLSPAARKNRMPEFDARVIALMKDHADIERCAQAFLRPSIFPKGNA
jgi:hypothetical protein